MAWLCVYVIFNKKREPLVAGILNAKTGIKKLYPLYNRGTGLRISDVQTNKAGFAKVITSAIANQVPIITSGFKTILSAFNIQLTQGFDYNVYDRCWETTVSDLNIESAKAVVSKMLDRLSQSKPNSGRRQ